MMSNQNRANGADGKQNQNVDSAPLVAGPSVTGKDRSKDSALQQIADCAPPQGEGSAVLVAGPKKSGNAGKEPSKRARKA